MSKQSELDEILFSFADYIKHHQRTGLGGGGMNQYEAKQAILDWHNKQVEEARVEGAQYIFNMLEANVMLVDDDEISRRKLMGNMYEHLRRYAERNKLKESKDENKT